MTKRVLLLLVAAACGKSSQAAAPAAETAEAKAEGGCAPFKATVEGKAIEGLTHAYAFTMVNEGYRTEMVEIYNRPVTCADALSWSRASPEGETVVRAFGGPAQGVGIDAYTNLVNVTTVAAKPAKVGDKMTICVKENSFAPNSGAFEGKNVTLAGAFTGEYCGDKLYAKK